MLLPRSALPTHICRAGAAHLIDLIVRRFTLGAEPSESVELAIVEQGSVRSFRHGDKPPPNEGGGNGFWTERSHHGTTPYLFWNVPVGPLGATCARRTIISTPSATVWVPVPPLMSVLVYPGSAALTRNPGNAFAY